MSDELHTLCMLGKEVANLSSQSILFSYLSAECTSPGNMIEVSTRSVKVSCNHVQTSTAGQLMRDCWAPLSDQLTLSQWAACLIAHHSPPCIQYTDNGTKVHTFARALQPHASSRVHGLIEKLITTSWRTRLHKAYSMDVILIGPQPDN
jgi:hypothetical protein